MTPVPDLVRLSKLDTRFHTDPQYTIHVEYMPGSGKDRRGVRREERWKQKKRLGRGGFGTVWLEQCIDGSKKDELRAVKQIQKHGNIDYFRELEAIALFSNAKVAISTVHRFLLLLCYADIYAV